MRAVSKSFPPFFACAEIFLSAGTTRSIAIAFPLLLRATSTPSTEMSTWSSKSPDNARLRALACRPQPRAEEGISRVAEDGPSKALVRDRSDKSCRNGQENIAYDEVEVGSHQRCARPG